MTDERMVEIEKAAREQEWGFTDLVLTVPEVLELIAEVRKRRADVHGEFCGSDTKHAEGCPYKPK